MSTFLFLFRELLGAVRARSAAFSLLSGLFILLCLSSFAFLLLLPAPLPPSVDLPAGVVVHLSPRLSAASVDALYLQIRERSDVKRINFRFAQEVNPGETGGYFFIEATSPDAANDIAGAIGALDGVGDVRVGGGEPTEGGIAIGTPLRFGLLGGIVVFLVVGLILARLGFSVLLRSFANEVRLMRLSGVSERMIHPPVVSLGILVGLLAGLLLIVGIYLFQYAAAEIEGLASLLSGGRALAISFAGLFLGVFMGGLGGLFGVSILSSREFDPLP
jgi:cell division protein FtsX